MVFPWIEQGLQEHLAAAQANLAAKFIVVDAAVMLEAGWSRYCDKIIYVDAPRRQRLARLASQRGWTEEEMQIRSQAQLPLAEKVARADAAIDNAGSPDALAVQVTKLLTLWRIPVALGAKILDNT